MKIQLDTVAKTIKVESRVSFQELIDVLEKLLPKGEWKKFNLETNVEIVNWHNPIYIKEVPSRPYIDRIWCKTDNDTMLLAKGEFNIEC